MVNILIITHGNLANEFVAIAESITGVKDKAIPVCFDLSLDSAKYPEIMASAIRQLDNSQPTVILTDLFGGTPSNFAIPYIQKDKVEVITGFNMPILMYLLTQSGDIGFETLCDKARQAGKDAIIIAGEFLS